MTRRHHKAPLLSRDCLCFAPEAHVFQRRLVVASIKSKKKKKQSSCRHARFPSVTARRPENRGETKNYENYLIRCFQRGTKLERIADKETALLKRGTFDKKASIVGHSSVCLEGTLRIDTIVQLYRFYQNSVTRRNV